MHVCRSLHYIFHLAKKINKYMHFKGIGDRIMIFLNDLFGFSFLYNK